VRLTKFENNKLPRPQGRVSHTIQRNLLPLVEDPELVAGTGEDKGGGEDPFRFPPPLIPRRVVYATLGLTLQRTNLHLDAGCRRAGIAHRRCVQNVFLESSQLIRRGIALHVDMHT
jgi:hypothetical protein